MRRTCHFLSSLRISITSTAVMGDRKVSSREETTFFKLGCRCVSVDSALCGRYLLSPAAGHARRLSVKVAPLALGDGNWLS
jgi:hypothetical protein